MTTSDLNKLEHKVQNLRQLIIQLEVTLQKHTPANDNLNVFKQQQKNVAKRKESKQEELSRVQEELNKIQAKVTAKEREMERLRGPDYKSKGDLREYANALREKSSKYKKVK